MLINLEVGFSKLTITTALAGTGILKAQDERSVCSLVTLHTDGALTASLAVSATP